MATKKTKRSKARVAKAPVKTAAKRVAARPARARSVKRGTLSIRTVTPSLTVNDIEKSLAWYRDVLGFTVKERWRKAGGVGCFGGMAGGWGLRLWTGGSVWFRAERNEEGVGLVSRIRL